ncbi:hypothetical protein LXM60_03090 [Pandoraea sputorum]|uniref:hypothetical protein n=1 Tax=Pandoraea sputorum TaxID=93222 RepID=UPI001E528055|nr:hypothetical protein [Pandoraea sputorum]MCE4059190.1 hypothetical protein [Pandoraea sputorum]
MVAVISRRQCLAGGKLHWLHVRRVALIALAAFIHGIALPAHALPGTDVAKIINSRYNDTRDKCAIDKPAFFCSGLIVRPLDGATTANFWAPTAGEAASQSMTFTFLRRDIEINALAYSAGFILSDTLTAAGQGKTMNVRCAYPLDQTITGNPGDHGCNLAGGDTGAADPNSCDTEGVTDVAAWLTHFATYGWQCSLSTTVASKFYMALQAHRAYADPKRAPSMLIAPWLTDTPRSIPIQAIYFDISNGGQLAQAQRYQMAYYQATREWLPILRMSFDDAKRASFGFASDDQLASGFETADELNRRFNDTRSECPAARASVYCSGVVIRAVVPGPTAWNPSADAISKNGVSTSFLRSDAYFYQPYRSDGFVFRALDAPAGYSLTPRCMYPPDGNLHIRADGCGPSTAGPETGPCAAIGVDTLDKWRAHYARFGPQGCSLAITASAFALSLQARQTFPRPPAGYETRNELVIAAWPANIPGSLPLEAFFYTGVAQAGAQTLQRAYYEVTGRFLPILKMESPVPYAGTIFSYHPEDQSSVLSTTSQSGPPVLRDADDDQPVINDPLSRAYP